MFLLFITNEAVEFIYDIKILIGIRGAELRKNCFLWLFYRGNCYLIISVSHLLYALLKKNPFFILVDFLFLKEINPEMKYFFQMPGN